jgi:hypothetical protein
MTPKPTQPDDEQSGGSDLIWCLPWNWPWGIWALLIAFGIMLLPFGIRALMLAGVPVMDEPFDVKEFVKWDVPAEEDAFTDYRLAVGLHERIVADLRAQSRTAPDNYDVVNEQGWAAADEPLKQWLELHREALEVWKRGTTKQKGMSLALDKLTYNSVLTAVQEQRTFTRLAVLAQARSIHEGRLEEAWEWARAANRCGGHTTHRGSLVQGLIGSAIHAVSTDGMARWAEQPGVTSEQLKAALAETKSDYTLYERESNLLKTEYLAGRNTLRSPNWSHLLDLRNSPNHGSGIVAAAIRMQFWVRGEPELAVRILRQVLANQLPEVDKPLASRRMLVGSGRAMLFDPDPAVSRAPGQLDADGINRIINRSTVIRQIMPAMKRFDSMMLRQAARQAAIESLLAAQAYRRDHGEFPETLSKLVPGYLEVVPLDPLNPGGGPLLYRRDDGATAVVWSVGIDGNDNGGDVKVTNRGENDTGFRIRFGRPRQDNLEPENEPAPTVTVEQLK